MKGMTRLGIAVLLGAAAANAGADHRQGVDRHQAVFDYAKVVSVEPVYERVSVERPRRECWEDYETRYEDEYRSPTPVVVGGILGGLLGNQIGGGSGRKVATVAGAVLGASVGNDVRHKRAHARTHEVPVERCRTVREYVEEQRTVGYDVRYRYRGHTYESRLDHDPGPRLRVRVSVLPAG